MKTKDILIVGGLVAAYLLYKSKRAAASGIGGGGIPFQQQAIGSVIKEDIAEDIKEKQTIFGLSQDMFSPALQEKIMNTPPEEWYKAFAIAPPQTGSMPYVSPQESSRNRDTISRIGGFTETRDGVFSKESGGGIAEGGSIRVIYAPEQ